MFDFPSPATSGQVFSPMAGVDYVFNGIAWELPSAGIMSITSLVPSYMEAGGPNLPLRVKGIGFIPTSVIYIDGAAMPTTFTDSSELKTTVQASAKPVGTASVTVRNGATPSNALTLNFVPRATLTTVVPATCSVAGGDVLVTATGTGFMPDSVGLCGAYELATTYISPTQLTATVQPAMGSSGQQVYFIVATGMIQSNPLFFNFVP